MAEPGGKQEQKRIICHLPFIICHLRTAAADMKSVPRALFLNKLQLRNGN